MIRPTEMTHTQQERALLSDLVEARLILDGLEPDIESAYADLSRDERLAAAQSILYVAKRVVVLLADWEGVE